ncbi:MAG: cytochrome c [Armatimonadetes bacterium]|nr:cytochrome c [Armatimonadota bacterium]
MTSAILLLLLGPPKAPAFRPLAYFEDKCARCHGSMGSNYGDEFGKDLTDAKLVTVVRDMASGPAQAPVSEVDLRPLVAFHRSLILGKPFGIVVEVVGATVRGETTPGSKVSLRWGKVVSVAKVDGSAWSAIIPKGKTLSGAELVLSLKGATVVQALDSRRYTDWVPSKK